MNERIREYARKARMLTGWQIGEFEIQKFAELILRECILICEERERPNLYGKREAQTEIKEHFGVE